MQEVFALAWQGKPCGCLLQHSTASPDGTLKAPGQDTLNSGSLDNVDMCIGMQQGAPGGDGDAAGALQDAAHGGQQRGRLGPRGRLGAEQLVGAPAVPRQRAQQELRLVLAAAQPRNHLGTCCQH